MAKKPTAPKARLKENDSAAMAAVAPRAGREADVPARVKKPGTPDPAKIWQERLTTSNKQYTQWSDKFECNRLDKYYEGHQWTGLSEEEARKKYVINLVFSTVETQLPSLLFSQPKVKVEARPNHEQTTNSDAGNRATLIEQTLQTMIDDPKVHFTFETTLALRDAYSRFALVEVGFSADYLDNPNVGKPVLNEKDEEFKDGADEPLTQPAKIANKESVYIKRLDPATFRVFPGRNLLEANDWAAYYEWHYVEDVKQNPDYTDTAELKATGRDSTDTDESSADPDIARHTGMVKIWKIWDFRRKVRHVLADGHKTLLQEGKPFTTFPIADLKFYEGRNAYYPVPPIYNWLSPQDEINESREQQKVHRRRASRRYMREPSVTVTEFEKLESGEDMVCIEVPKINPPPIAPIQDAPLDGSNWTELAASKDDFSLVSGVGGEARGVPEAPTATQANIVNVRAQLRESRARTQVATWLGWIARLMLLAVREKAQLPLMVKQTVDPFAFPADPQAVGRSTQAWKEIKAEDIADLDVDIKIDVASLSPVAEEADRNAWNTVLQLLTNPALTVLLMTPHPEAPNEPSPMLRKTLMLNGVTSDQEVREIWRIGQAALAAAAKAEQVKAQGEQKPDEPKISYNFKGEDLSRPEVLQAFLRAEGLQAMAAATPAEVPPVPSTDGSGGAPLPAQPAGPATGVPAGALA